MFDVARITRAVANARCITIPYYIPMQLIHKIMNGTTWTSFLKYSAPWQDRHSVASIFLIPHRLPKLMCARKTLTYFLIQVVKSDPTLT